MRLSTYKLQKILFFAFMIFLAYYLFTRPYIAGYYNDMDELSMLVVPLFSGMLLAFGFTLPLSIASFMSLHPANIALSVFLGLLGATVSNLFIFYFFKESFMNSFDRSSRNPILRRFDVEMKKGFLERWKLYLSCTFVGFLMALPISEETETLIMTGFKEIESSYFILLSMLLNLIIISAILIFL